MWPFGRKKKKKAQPAKPEEPKQTLAFRSLFDLPQPKDVVKSGYISKSWKSTTNPLVLKEHFSLLEMLDKAPASRQAAIAWQMVRLSKQAASAFEKASYFDGLPRNPGYDRLAINFEKQKKFEWALLVCRHAQNEGWSDDWEKRIERIESKMKRAGKK